MNRSREFINALNGLRDQRGRLAELRRGLSQTSFYAALPTLISIGGNVDSIVDRTIAGFFALHPLEAETPSLGATWRELRYRAYNTLPEIDKDRTSFEHRFTRLLACSTKHELCEHLRHFILRAKSEGIGINYIVLHEDITHWEWSRIRLKWAKDYWHSYKQEEAKDEISEET